MKFSILAVMFALLVATPCFAQTVGVPGVNDVIINGVGSGGTSCIDVTLDAGDPWVTQMTTYGFSPIVGAFAAFCNPLDLIIDGTYSLDIDQNTLDFLYDGTGAFLFVGLSPFSVANSNGDFGVTITTTELYRVTFGYQAGMVNAAFPNGLGVSPSFACAIQAHELLTTPMSLTPLSDDGNINLVMGGAFGFDFYGTNYTDVYVNMNGNLTFGSGDSDFTPSDNEMVSDQPRIAPAWDDWTPSDSLQGDVKVEDNAVSFSIEWYDVRHFGTSQCGGNNQDTNTFAATLEYGTGKVLFSYGAMLLCQGGSAPTTDTLVGISPGGNLSALNNVDLSAGNIGGTNVAIYEDFDLGGFGAFDFSHLTCCFNQKVVFTPLGSMDYAQTVE